MTPIIFAFCLAQKHPADCPLERITVKSCVAGKYQSRFVCKSNKYHHKTVYWLLKQNRPTDNDQGAIHPGQNMLTWATITVCKIHSMKYRFKRSRKYESSVSDMQYDQGCVDLEPPECFESSLCRSTIDPFYHFSFGSTLIVSAW